MPHKLYFYIFWITAVVSTMPMARLFAHAHTLHYEPESVTLIGTVEEQAFPGRPGYESIKNGDEVERGWYLRLSSAIDLEFAKNEGDSNAEPEKDVKVLQIAGVSDKAASALLKLAGKRAKLRGVLFHAYTAHHHARVLLRVHSIEAAEP